MRRRTLIEGLLVAVVVGLLMAYGSGLGDQLPALALAGAGLGAVVALVPHRSTAGRAGAFLVGFGACWLGLALRVGFLPATNGGRAIGALVTILIITAVAVATADRLPLWAGLVGAATLSGAYEYTLRATPDLFTSQSVTYATTVLLAAGVAFAVVSLLPEYQTEPVAEARRADATPPDPDDRVGVDLFKSKTSEA